MSGHLVRADRGMSLTVTPETAEWTYLHFAVLNLAAGADQPVEARERETAIVPLSGSATIDVDDRRFELRRKSVWAEMPQVLYVPPGCSMGVSTTEGFTCAVGGAPAEGRYPVRLIEPSEMRSEVRGGGAARRQVNHILAHPLPAERLILYEVYVPRGTWSGWPPHCHDGYAGSPYLEETYYFRLDPPDGFALHRNWREDTEFDETLRAGDGDVALVTQGFHSSVACPGSNMYFLNYLAGELVGDQRATPPYFHPAHTWIEADWSAGLMGLPAVE